ncbi:DUF7882 family protein [Clavibacter sp. km1a]|uniref:DUF7882 family protein n=1 Tax=Clavibacter sp. km1a TaxID=3459136 RepID=UPI00404375FD
MGHLIHDTTTRTQIDDRALAHLQVMIVDELRRRESSTCSRKDPASERDGRSTVWIAPESPLRSTSSGSRPPVIDARWVEALLLTAGSTAGRSRKQIRA